MRVTLDGIPLDGVPLSGEAVRRYVEAVTAAGEDEARVRALTLALVRLAFPLSWRRLWWRDRAWRIVNDPRHLAWVAEAISPPRPPAKRPEAMDDWDRLEAAQRVDDDPGGVQVTLDTVCRLTEHELGASWYHDPSRWPTRDGFAPLSEVWRAWRTIAQARAFERLNIIRAIGTTKAGARAQAMVDADVQEALRDG